MKRFFYFAAAAMMLLSACNNDNTPITAVLNVTLELDGQAFAAPDFVVTVSEKSSAARYKKLTDENGAAKFTLPVGLYEVAVSGREIVSDGVVDIYNGVKSAVEISADEELDVVIELAKSTGSQVVIKEFYGMGSPKEDKTNYAYAEYCILYNNSDTEVDISDYCFAFGSPLNANANNKYRTDGSDPSYWAAGVFPAPYAVWWFTSTVKIQPYSQIVVSIFGAIDHTKTVPSSVNLADPSYYVMYDTESGFNNTSKYPAPAEAIPATQYLKTYRYGLGNAWPISGTSPAFFICKKSGMEAFSKDNTNYDTTDGSTIPNLKIPVEWIIDGVDIYDAEKADACQKRFPASIDAGYVYITSKQGHSLYRNVDKEATEALPENEGKLVYNYALGTADIEKGSTDPSGIDAEASIAVGAHIIYKDTNNSTADFHERKTASLKK